LKREREKMKTLTNLIAAVCLSWTAFAQQSNQPAKPGPEVQKMSIWYGDWTYEGEILTTPLGPGAKVTGKMTCRPVLSRFAVECTYDEKGPSGETHSIELCWYDPANKKYAYVYLSNDGYMEQGPFMMNENGDTWEANCVAGGKPFKMRGVEVVLSGGTILTRKPEISIDGKTWLPYASFKTTKVKSVSGATTPSKK
jgi:hypothetical protein